MQSHSRRAFIAAGSISLAGGAAMAKGFSTATEPEIEKHTPVRATPDRMREFVGACHVQIDKVRAMLEIDPDLAKASWDWGFGDYETAIGACSHTGRKDIIELLLAHGARPTIFTLATLDKIAAVQGFIESMPGARDIEGPHSISLYRHAQAGKATRVIAYLEKEGLDQDAEIFRTEQSHVDRFVGRYAVEGDNSAEYQIAWAERFKCLSLKVGDESARNLIPVAFYGGTRDQGTQIFRPAGSRGARITLSGTGTLNINYAGQKHDAKRISD